MNVCPLAIILVKNGSGGERLLFKYPFTFNESAFSSKGKKNSQFSLPIKVHKSSKITNVANISANNFSNLPDEVVSHLFAVNNKLCGAKFELKVNDVRFVGHPISLEEIKDKRKESSITLFHIVFALKSSLGYDIVNCFHDLSKRLGVALKGEERRCQFLHKEAKIMINAQDEASQLPESVETSAFELCLQKSLVAKHIKDVYEGLCYSGEVNILLNHWIHISFCLPRRIINGFGTITLLTNEMIMNGLKYVKPYHTFLLLVDKNDILNSLTPDASPALRRLLIVHSPISPFYTLAADADLTLQQVVLLAGHLVYWGKATILYPVCNTNLYVLSFKTPMSRKFADKFAEDFPRASYHTTLAEFSLPISFRDKTTAMTLPAELQLENMKLLWLLKHGFLQQLHTYVYISPIVPVPKVSTGGSLRSQLETVSEGMSDDNRDILDSDTESVNSGSQLADGKAYIVYLSARNRSANLSDIQSEMNMSTTYNDVVGNNTKDSMEYISALLSEHLSPAEKDLVMKMESSQNIDDLRTFAKLCRYFKGQHHIEEIMYRSNLCRSEVFETIEKFRPILFTVQHADPLIYFVRGPQVS